MTAEGNTDTLARPLEVGLRWACLALAAILTLPGLLRLSAIWERQEYLAHGYMIPLVAVFLLWQERILISRAFRSAQPPAWGVWLVSGAVIFEALALFGDVMVAAGLGIPLLLAVTVYAIGGSNLLRTVRLPISFLILMVPPPGFLVSRALFELKLGVTRIAVGLLQFAGATVAAEGNEILIPGHTLFVADACSGLTSIITLIPLAVIVAYFLGRGTWRRILIVASIVPLAVGANIIRVALTVSMVSSRGIGFAQGLLHESFGITTFALGTLCLIGIARILR